MLAAVMVALVAGASSASAGPSKPLSIFLIVGQSNAAGYGQPVPAREKVDSRVWDLSSGARLARNPLGDAPGVGFPLTTGQELARHGLRVGLVQCAAGGLSIAAWQPGAERYEHCLEQARAALQYGVIRGVLFHQGETDSASPELARAWPAKFLTFVRSFRRDLELPRLPIVFGLTRDFTACADCNLPYGATLRAGQRSIDVDGVSLVEADDLAVDGEHFTPAAYAVLGRRYAAAWLALARASATPKR